MAQSPDSSRTDPANVDSLISNLETGAADATSAAQAVQQAVDTAQEIAADIQSADASALPPAPLPAALAGSAPLASDPPSLLSGDLHRLLTIEVPIIVQLGVRRMTVGEVMRLAVGAIIEFHKAADDELELLANNKVIGKGHAVKVGENFGIKLTSTGPIKETIRILGGV